MKTYLLTLLVILGCGPVNRDATQPKRYAVECYSGGVTVFSADVTPDSWFSANDNGVSWREAGKRRHIRADCVVEQI